MAEKTKPLLFYFDFMRPFAYLAHLRLPELARTYGLAIDYRVMDLPAAKLAAGNTGPRNVEIPPKIRYLKIDLERWAHRYGAPFVFPPSLASERMNKGVFYAADRGKIPEYVTTAWAACWGRGEDMNDDAVLAGVAARMGWNGDEFLASLSTAATQARYQANNQEAQARGVFGVPMMVLDDQMWWGNDRFDFMEEYLRQTRS